MRFSDEAEQFRGRLAQKLDDIVERRQRLESDLSRLNHEEKGLRNSLKGSGDLSQLGDYCCPRCYVFCTGMNVVLRPISGTETVDRFRCNSCNLEFEREI